RALGYGAIYHAAGIHEDDGLLLTRRSQCPHKLGQAVEPPADHLMVVVAPGIARDAPMWFARRREITRSVRQIKGAERNDGARAWEQRARVRRALGTLRCEPVQPAQQPCGDALL